MSATRRLAAIMAIDVVGYSRLMGEDEAGTARAVKEHRDAARPILAALGGRIVKTMGDGLLLEFPSVVAAVEGAIAIQKLMAKRNADTPEAISDTSVCPEPGLQTRSCPSGATPRSSDQSSAKVCSIAETSAGSLSTIARASSAVIT